MERAGNLVQQNNHNGGECQVLGKSLLVARDYQRFDVSVRARANVTTWVPPEPPTKLVNENLEGPLNDTLLQASTFTHCFHAECASIQPPPEHTLVPTCGQCDSSEHSQQSMPAMHQALHALTGMKLLIGTSSARYWREKSLHADSAFARRRAMSYRT